MLFKITELAPVHGRENVREFQLQVEDTMMTVDARTIKYPDIYVGAVEGPETCQGRTLKPDQKFLRPVNIKNWGCVSFTRDDTSNLQKTFIRELQNQATARGMVLNDYTVPTLQGWQQPGYDVDLRDAVTQYLKEFIDGFQDIKVHPPGMPETRLDLILFFMDKRLFPHYATVKYLCDVVYGVPSQVVLISERNEKRLKDYVQTMLYKINLKCGGVNYKLHPSMLQVKGDGAAQGRTMILGADVTHGGLNKGFPALAAVVASVNEDATTYACRLRPQKPKQEIIVELEAMVTELLNVFREKSGSYPDNIVFFRDGVAEWKFPKTLQHEGSAILRAAKALGTTASVNYEPKLMITLAVKRHHTRFFQIVDDSVHPPVVENLQGGTVVLSGVTHPRDFDSFLCSHWGRNEDTSKPTHYYVVLDQIDIAQDNMYKLAFNLCCSFQRCSKPVSLVAPVQYAHLAAFRAKLYMEFYDTTPDKAHLFTKSYDSHANLKNGLWFL